MNRNLHLDILHNNRQKSPENDDYHITSLCNKIVWKKLLLKRIVYYYKMGKALSEV